MKKRYKCIIRKARNYSSFKSIGDVVININSYLKDKREKYGFENINRLDYLYENITNANLKIIFSKIHFELNVLLKYLNERMSNGHYNAAESRNLMEWIEEIEDIESNLKNTDMQFIIKPYYKSVFQKCSNFLHRSGGSPIPPGFEKINISSTEPIFVINNMTTISRGKSEDSYPITLIGEGSYAKVFKYKDEYYNKYFVIKRANKNLDIKEHERFKLEYEIMEKLNSPYIVEVYRFSDEKHEYIMEYVDQTLYKYVNINNSKLTKGERKNIVLQILKAFEYIHSQKLLHRDISLTNILIKKYDGLNIVKVSDFGLVKIEDSNLTSVYSELKGSLNDPNLELYGFKNYAVTHETYALTRVIYFIMTGRTKIDKDILEPIKSFVLKGIDADLSKRYKSISDLKIAFETMYKNVS